MARKDDGGNDSAPDPRKFTVYGNVGKFRAGDTVTTADLFPGETDQAALDAHTHRLLTLSVIAPLVEFATAVAIAEPASIPAVATAQTDAKTLADEHAATKPPAFKPVNPGASAQK